MKTAPSWDARRAEPTAACWAEPKAAASDGTRVECSVDRWVWHWAATKEHHWAENLVQQREEHSAEHSARQTAVLSE